MKYSDVLKTLLLSAFIYSPFIQAADPKLVEQKSSLVNKATNSEEYIEFSSTSEKLKVRMDYSSLDLKLDIDLLNDNQHSDVLGYKIGSVRSQKDDLVHLSAPLFCSLAPSILNFSTEAFIERKNSNLNIKKSISVGNLAVLLEIRKPWVKLVSSRWTHDKGFQVEEIKFALQTKNLFNKNTVFEQIYELNSNQLFLVQVTKELYVMQVTSETGEYFEDQSTTLRLVGTLQDYLSHSSTQDRLILLSNTKLDNWLEISTTRNLICQMHQLLALYQCSAKSALAHIKISQINYQSLIML